MLKLCIYKIKGPFILDNSIDKAIVIGKKKEKKRKDIVTDVEPKFR